MIIIKITQVEMRPKPGGLSCFKVLLIDQDAALNYIRRQTNFSHQQLRKGIKSHEIG